MDYSYVSDSNSGILWEVLHLFELNVVYAQFPHRRQLMLIKLLCFTGNSTLPLTNIHMSGFFIGLAVYFFLAILVIGILVINDRLHDIANELKKLNKNR